MTSKNFIISIVAIGACISTAMVAAFGGENNASIGVSRAATTDKEFSFDSAVGSNVSYGQYYSSIETGIGSPIQARFYRSEGESKNEGMHHSGCFYGFQYANRRTHVFEAGINNLTGFELELKFSYNSLFDTDYTPFNYTAILTFYHGNDVVGEPVEYVQNPTTRETTYKHTWTKTTEPEKIDKVTCSLAVNGGSSKDDWCNLYINYFKLYWKC